MPVEQTYRIEELNPFFEWHRHGTADDQSRALLLAEALCQKIKRPVRVLDEADKVIEVFEPTFGKE
jgi:hypothetical protein|tara:strand:+ start:119 stop:316 length:198 start_codon:yes stop_codon:yes gene_type:complete